jgi:hypothetical protein
MANGCGDDRKPKHVVHEPRFSDYCIGYLIHSLKGRIFLESIDGGDHLFFFFFYCTIIHEKKRKSVIYRLNTMIF